MQFDKNYIFIALLCLIFIFIIPLSFAESGDVENITSVDNQSEIVMIEEDEEVLQADNDYYFNASAEVDGDGSMESPYQYITAERIKSNCNIYLADGEYSLDAKKSIERVNIVGSGTNKTVLKYDGVAFRVNKYLTLTNITLNGLSIENNATLNATNTIFNNAIRGHPTSYQNNFGGAIYTYSDNNNSKVTINNCTFENNEAVYGGAIYMGAGCLEVVNSYFINNYAYNYGGAIACENVFNVTVSKSKFIKNWCFDDSGGAIYIKYADNFKASDVEINQSSATFGGAITTLSCNVLLSGVTANNNAAKWDGGAIYHMYGTFDATYLKFTNNSAGNGGALFIGCSDSLAIRYSTFINNTASGYGSAIYSIFNKLKFQSSLNQYNTFINNDIAEMEALNLTIGGEDYIPFTLNETEIISIPSSYNLIDEAYLTPVKDQQAGGNCWAFTAMAVLESCIKKITGTEFDLSEENMKNLMAIFSYYGWRIDTNLGGLDYMPYAYLTSWLGPVLEQDDVYDDYSVLSAVLSSICHVQNIQFFTRNNATDNDEIKKAILKYGAVGTSIYYDNYYMNSGYNYYTWIGSDMNHAVTIVGWDDNYSKDHFKFSSEIEGDGAWIVRNSWGSNWGVKHGYFYVSYYDKSLAKAGLANSAYTFILNDTKTFIRNYQYDIGGVTDYLYNSNSSVFYKNRFVSAGYELLSAVSTYFEKLTNWTVSVYVDGTLKTVKSGMSPAGYWTINLDDEILLDEGDVFEVIFHTVCDTISSVPISEKASLNSLTYYPGISYISYDGENWYDLYDYTSSYAIHNYFGSVACIKAFTSIADLNTTTYLDIDYNGFNPVNITVTVIDELNRRVNGTVVLNLNGYELELDLINGTASLSYNFEKGENTVAATFSQKGFKLSSNSTSFTVVKNEVFLSMDYSLVQNNLFITLSADNDINESISLFVNDRQYSLNLTDGKVSMNLTGLENGNYTISAVLKSSLWYSQTIYENLTVNVKNTYFIAENLNTTESSGDLFTVQLVGEDGAAIAGKEIIFTLVNESISKTTDSDGKASVPVSLTNGIYDINVKFSGDNEYFNSSHAYTVTVKTLVDIDLELYKYQNSAQINISLSRNINETADVYVNGEYRRCEITNGKGTITLSSLENHNYTVTVSLDEDKYECQQKSVNFTVNVKNTQIIAFDLTANDEGEIEFGVTLADANGNPLANKTVIFTLNGNSTASTSSDGRASHVYSLERGFYTVNACFMGDDSYRFSNASNKITVKTNVNAEITVVKYFYDANVTVVFSKPLNETVSLKLNNNAANYTLTNGKMSVLFENLENGEYNITCELLNDGYNFTKLNSGFSVNVIKTYFIADDLNTTENSLDNFTVTLVGENGKGIGNKQIKFTLGGADYYAVTDENGHASVPVNLTQGKYTLTAAYSNSSDVYDTSEISKEIIVKIPISAEITYTRVLNNVSVDISFTRPINETVYVSINGNADKYTVENGRLALTLNNLSNNNYSLGVLLDDEKYEFGDISTRFTVDVKETRIISNDFSTYFSSGGEFEMALVDENGKAVAGRQLMVIYNGITANATTGADGKAAIPVYLGTGKYTVQISFMGDNDYLKSQSSSTITVESSILFMQSTYALNSKYSVKLYDKNGLITGNSASVILNGVKYTVSPSNGVFSVNVNLKVGTYTVSVENPITGEVKTQKISVVARLSGNKNVVMYYGANKKFQVRAFSDHGKAVGSGQIVVIKINGKTYKAKTNSKGYAYLKLTFKSKKYKITATYKGFTVSNWITIKPTLITKNKVVRKGKTVKFTAKLLNKNGKVLKGKKITFKVKGKTYKVKTNKKGIATLTLKKLKVGKYKIVSSYGKLKSVNRITIKK